MFQCHKHKSLVKKFTQSLNNPFLAIVLMVHNIIDNLQLDIQLSCSFFTSLYGDRLAATAEDKQSKPTYSAQEQISIITCYGPVHLQSNGWMDILLSNHDCPFLRPYTRASFVAQFRIWLLTLMKLHSYLGTINITSCNYDTRSVS